MHVLIRMIRGTVCVALVLLSLVVLSPDLISVDGSWPDREYSPPAHALTEADVMGPDGRVYPDWTSAGVVGDIPDTSALPVYSVGPPSGGDDIAAITAAVATAAASGGGIVQLEAGVYHLQKPLLIINDNIVLRGAGRHQTHLRFTYTLDEKEARWFQPSEDGADVYYETPLELHASGSDVKKVTYRVDDVAVPESTLSWTADAGNHEYSIHSLGLSLFGTGLLVDGQTHTIEAIITWQDDTRSILSRTITARQRWQAPETLRRYALGRAAIAIGGDAWTGRGGYRWKLYKSVARGDRAAYILHGDGSSPPVAAGSVVEIRGRSSDAWDALVDNTGMENTKVAQLIPVASIREAEPEELVEPVPSGYSVSVIEFAQPVRHRYTIGALESGGMDPEIDASFFPIQGVGIESLTLEQPENPGNPAHDDELFAHGISMSVARNCWIQDVVIRSAGRHPVSLGGLNLSVRNCRFEGSWWTHVGQGTAYVGVDQSYDILFENIVGLHLRHAPNAQASASGNVLRNSVFYGADAQYHYGWAAENLYEQITVDARSFRTQLRGDEGVNNGSYSFGIYAQHGHGDLHSPGAGPRNVVFASDFISTNSGLFLGDATEHMMVLHNRFRVKGDAPGVVMNDHVHDAILANNTFVMASGGYPLIAFPVDAAINPRSGNELNRNVGNSGIEVTDNKMYRPGAVELLADGSGVDLVNGNQWLPYAANPARPAVQWPSIYAWQMGLPQISILTPHPWENVAVGVPVQLEAKIQASDGTAMAVPYSVRWFVDGEQIASGNPTSWTPSRPVDADLRVEVELGNGTISRGPSLWLFVHGRPHDLPLERDQVHLRWRADADTMDLDVEGRVLVWRDLKSGRPAVRDGQNTFFPSGDPDPVTGPLWTMSAIGDKPALSFDEANDGLGYSAPVYDGLGVAPGQLRTLFLVLSHSQDTGGQVFGAGNTQRVAVDESGRNRVNLRYGDEWSTGDDVLQHDVVQVIAVRGGDGATDVFVNGSLVGGSSQELFHYGHNYDVIRMGSGAFATRDFVGLLAEVVLVLEDLSDADIESTSHTLRTYYTNSRPADVIGFTLSPALGSSLELSWSESIPEAQFQVQKLRADGVWETVALEAGNSNGWTDNLLAPGSTHTYRARVISPYGDTPFTDSRTATVWTEAENWRQTHFGTPAPNGQAAEQADPDNDGCINLLERAFGSDPNNSAETAHAEMRVVTIGDSRLPSIVFQRWKGGTGPSPAFYEAAGLRYEVWHSEDLQNWVHTPELFSLLESPSDHGDVWETVQLQFNEPLLSGFPVFIKVSVTGVP